MWKKTMTTREITIKESKGAFSIFKKSIKGKEEYDFSGLSALRQVLGNEKARILVRKEIPITFIGNLSTYLRAVESDKNKEQYKKNKEILNKFIGKMS